MTVSFSTQLLSNLGNNASSIYPLAFKDTMDSVGRTAMGYKAGGKIEAREKFVDETGTGLIWVFGIPLLKKVFDKTVYKAFKMDPSVDVRLLNSKNDQNLKFAIDHSDGAINKSLQHVSEHKDLFKGLAFAKFATATSLSLVALYKLIKYNQNETKKRVYAQAKKDLSNKQFLSQQLQKETTFTAFSGNYVENHANKNAKKPSNVAFKGGAGIVEAAKDFMFNPLKNTMILDAGITTERIKQEKRNPVAKAEVMIKEGGLVFFMYFGGKYIQHGLEKLADKFNMPINLDVKVLDDKKFQQDIKEPAEMLTKLKSFPDAKYDGKKLTDKSYNEIFQHIHSNHDTDYTVQLAKKMGLIDVTKNKAGNEVINTASFLNVEEIADLNKNLKKFAKVAKASKEPIENFVQKAVKTKKGSIVANLALCSLCVGYLVPKAQLLFRKSKTGTEKYHVAEQYKKEAELSFQATC